MTAPDFPKEYRFENGHEVDTSRLIAGGNLPLDLWVQIHQSVPIPTHDIAIEYEGGILLVNRDNVPAKDILWIMGGRMERGISTEESLRRRVKKECGLELEDPIKYLGVTREYWETDPFGHGKGTDTIGFIYFGKGRGKLALDHLHSKPIILTPEKYTAEFRRELHPRISYALDMAVPLIGKDL